MKTEDITEENLHKYVIKAIDKNRDLKIWNWIDVNKLKDKLGVIEMDDSNKIEELIGYLGNDDNFKNIFKVVE